MCVHVEWQACTYLLSQLLVFGCQRLAVTTPGRIELDENVFGGVVDDLVELLCHHHLRDNAIATCAECYVLTHYDGWRNERDV